MPLINYLCECGKTTKKYVKLVADVLKTVDCAKCEHQASRVFGNTSSSTKVVIDNGLMARKLELDPAIMEINDERSAKDYSED
jgi:hypothetical protein